MDTHEASSKAYDLWQAGDNTGEMNVVPDLFALSRPHTSHDKEDSSLPSKTPHQNADPTSKPLWGSPGRLNDHIPKNYPQLWEQYVRERGLKRRIPECCQDSSQSPINFVSYAARGFLRSLGVNPDTT